MQNIAINNNAHFLPFKRYFESINLDWQTLSAQQGIAIFSGDSSSSWLSSQQVLRFLEYLELTKQLHWAEDIAQLFDFEAAWPGLETKIKTCNSLVDLVQLMLFEHPKASSHGYLWLEEREGKIYLCNASSSKTNSKLNSQIELYRALLIQRFFQIYLGKDWHTKSILLATDTSPYTMGAPLETITTVGADVTAIEIPYISMGELSQSPSRRWQTPIEAVDKLLINLVGLEKLSIELIAAQLGLSKRTLQRALASQGLSFKQMRRKASIQHAIDLLKQIPSISNDELVHQCGYSAYPNFHRAFKAESGMTPSDIRKQLRQRPRFTLATNSE
ncbi:helix-turn-helix domain-containing protein [Vibrio mexicanus]|uniref:helix-turn-helix domain-containing protein n=1 Tax=Vibrio mexicanus TaxID=1004326 RepID=UPI00063C814B|nr:helix-turn-helix domain-containing protein [Vibrio mexicanus]